MRNQNILADQDDHNNTVINFLQCTGYKFIDDLISEIQGALIDSNPIIYDYSIHVLQLYYGGEEQGTLYNDDNSALALIDATEQEAETKEFFCEP